MTRPSGINERRRAARDRIASECKDMIRLRDELDRRGIEWWDESDYIQYADGCDSSGIMIARTKWIHDGGPVSVVWGYHATADGGYGLTKHWPVLLECWHTATMREPAAMTVEEILEVCTNG